MEIFNIVRDIRRACRLAKHAPAHQDPTLRPAVVVACWDASGDSLDVIVRYQSEPIGTPIDVPGAVSAYVAAG